MHLPLTDWQFWAATAVALLALRHVFRMLLPTGLPIGKRRRAGSQTRATLTVDRKPVDR